VPAYHFTISQSENKELLEKVMDRLIREIPICKETNCKIIESPTIMNPYSWSGDPGRRSWESVGDWAIQLCVAYDIGQRTREQIDNCISDFMAGWRACMNEWNAVIDAQEVRAELIRQNKERKNLWKASFDPKQCLNCRNRVDCLPLDIKKMFYEDKYHYNRNLGCVFEARINHWNHKGLSVVEVYSRGGTWREASRYHRSLNTDIWFTINPRILEEMRRTIVYSERGYRQEVGVNFAWLNYDKPKEKRRM